MRAEPTLPAALPAALAAAALLLSLAALPAGAAFLPAAATTSSPFPPRPSSFATATATATATAASPPPTALGALPDPSHLPEALSSASLLLSTIDSDIASISDDQFGKVFAGGIAVMLGGVASALVVGFLLDAGDSYSAIVGDSYEDQVTRDDIMADEEFWSQLTPEQQVEARELLGKASAALNGDGGGGGGGGGRGEGKGAPAPAPAPRRKEDISMFDDY